MQVNQQDLSGRGNDALAHATNDTSGYQHVLHLGMLFVWLLLVRDDRGWSTIKSLGLSRKKARDA